MTNENNDGNTTYDHKCRILIDAENNSCYIKQSEHKIMNFDMSSSNIHKKFKEGFEYLGFGNYISVKDRKTGQVSPLNGNANFFKRK